MATGTIARLLIDKGFGFIRDEGGTEHFFHRSAVRDTVFELLREGQRVDFQPEESTQGPARGQRPSHRRLIHTPAPRAANSPSLTQTTDASRPPRRSLRSLASA